MCAPPVCVPSVCMSTSCIHHLHVWVLFNVFFRVSLRVSLPVTLRLFVHVSLCVLSVCPSECPSAYVLPYILPCVPLYVPPYVSVSLYVPLCVFLPFYISLHVSLWVALSVCDSLYAPPLCELELQVRFSDLMYRSVWCSLARGASVPWEQQLQVDLFYLIYLPALSIPQSSLARGQAYVGAAAAGVVFRPNLLISLM